MTTCNQLVGLVGNHDRIGFVASNVLVSARERGWETFLNEFVVSQ